MKKTLIAAALAVGLMASAQATDLSLNAGSYQGVQRQGIALEAAPIYVNGGFSVVPMFEVANLRYQQDNLIQVSAVPMLRYNFGTARAGVFTEAGIGASAISRTSLGDKEFGSAFQFSSNLGLGYRFNENLSVSYRISHFSNAGIKSQNDGVTMQSVVLGLKF